MQHVRDLLRETDLVSIVGPGGIGKTRLSAQLCQGEARVCFVALAACTDLPSVCLRVALALGGSFTHEHVDEELLARLTSLLADAELDILVLDNAEQAIDAVAQVVSAARSLSKVIVTTREPLALSGERVLELEPLDTDGPAADAAALFRDRAGAALTEDAASEDCIQKIVEDVSGMPLAIELAASRLGVLTLQQIAARLSETMAVLRSGRRDLAPRHRRMQATLQWSWDLLTTNEQRALTQLSVFPADFHLEAAEAVVVVGAQGEPVVDLVEGLLHKSLLRRRLGDDGTPRFEMYGLVQRFASAQAALGGIDEAALAVRHATYYVDCGEVFRRARRTPEVVPYQRWLRREQANLIHIASRKLLTDELSVRAVLVLERTLRAHYPAAHHRMLLDNAEGGAGAPEAQLDSLPPAELERKLAVRLSRARICAREGDVQQALAQAGAVCDHASRHEQLTPHCEALTLAVNLHYMQGDTMVAISRGEQALTLVASAEAGARAELHMELGVAHHMHGNMDASRDCYEQALSLAVSVGHLTAEADTLACMGFFQQDLGQLADAGDSYARCLDLLTMLDRRDVEAIVHGYVGNLQRRQRDRAACLASYDRAQKTLRLIGDRHFEAVVLMDRGLALLDMGDIDAAEQALSGALSTLGPAKDLLIQALSKGGQAIIAAQREEVDRADALMREAVAHSEEDGPRRRVLGLFEGHMALARSRAAKADGDRAGADRWLEQARRTLEREQGGSTGASDYWFLAMRLLDEAVCDSANSVMQATADGSWLRASDGTEIDLANRSNLREILKCLIVAYRNDAPVVDAVALRQAGWPGEAMTKASAKNRVRVAIATLRKAGLRTELVTVEAGYALRPLSGRLAIINR